VSPLKRIPWRVLTSTLDIPGDWRIIGCNFRLGERHTMRILLILASLIVGTMAGIYLFGMIWRTTAPEGSMAMVVGGGTPVVLGALTFLGTRNADGNRPSLRNAQAWFALLGIAAAAAGLFLLLIVAVFLTAQRG
jgi:hypothetical protein